MPVDCKLMEYIFDWMREEAEYTRTKWTQEKNDEATKGNYYLEENMWRQNLEMYLHRSTMLGLDLPGGRQALAKWAITAMSLLESAIRLYGPLPVPGVTSGENCHPFVPFEPESLSHLKNNDESSSD